MITKKRYNSWLFSLSIGCFTLFALPIHSNQIAISPALIQGNLPGSSVNKSDLNMPVEFSKLSRDIIERNFLTNAVLLNDVTDRSSQAMSKSCLQSRSHFVIQDEYYFPGESVPSVLTTVFNCRTKSIDKKEVKLNGFVIPSLERHYRSFFRFLPQKESKPSYSPAQTPDIAYFLDSSGAFSIEKSPFQSLLKTQTRWKDRSIYTFAISSNQRVNERENNLPFAGKNETSQLHTHFNQFIAQSTRNNDGIYQVIFIAPNHVKQPLPWITAINQSRLNGKKSILIIPYNTNHLEYQEYRKIINATQSFFIEPIAYREVGLVDGSIGFLSLRSGYLYFTKENPVRKSETLTSAERYSAGESPSPYNMTEIYQQLSKKSIIQKGELLTNTTDILTKELNRLTNPQSIDGKRLLVRSGNIGLWIQVNGKRTFTKNSKYILETEFFRDATQSSGINNDIMKTEIHSFNYDYPKLLEYHPTEIKGIMDKYNLNSLRTYLPITVEDID